MQPRVSLITLGVADVARARAFYERLGWRASSAGGDEVAFFQLGPIALALYRRDALAADAGVPLAPPGAVELAHNVASRDEVDRTLAAAQAAGARVLKPAAPTSWGGYVAHFADPDGHPWEIAWNPGFTLGADGALILPD